MVYHGVLFDSSHWEPKGRMQRTATACFSWYGTCKMSAFMPFDMTSVKSSSMSARHRISSDKSKPHRRKSLVRPLLFLSHVSYIQACSSDEWNKTWIDASNRELILWTPGDIVCPGNTRVSTALDDYTTPLPCFSCPTLDVYEVRAVAIFRLGSQPPHVYLNTTKYRRQSPKRAGTVR